MRSKAAHRQCLYHKQDTIKKNTFSFIYLHSIKSSIQVEMKTPLKIFLLHFLSILSLTNSNAQTIDSLSEIIPSPVFKNGEAQPVPEFSIASEWIKEELWVETTFDSDKDGKLDRMHVFVTRPKATQSGKLKLPVIYTSSPYNGLRLFQFFGLFSKSKFWNVHHEIGKKPKSHKHPHKGTRSKRPFESFILDRSWVPLGFVMVYSSSPGTGLSDGAQTIGGENESQAPKAVIDWLCGRAKGYKTRKGKNEVFAFWCSGKVGMTGTSYDGTLCLAAATTGVDGLEAIIPVAPVSSFYHYYRSNGLVRSPEGYIGEDMDVLYDFINTGSRRKRKRNNARIRDSLLVKSQDRITGDYNDFWRSRDYSLKIEKMNCAMLMSHGFNDWNVMTEQSYRFYNAVKEKGLPVQLYYHQHGHGGNPPKEMMNKWFTRYLFGIENGIENEPPVRIVREYERLPNSYSSYPDSNSSNVVLKTASGTKGIGKLSTEISTPQVNETLYDDYSIKYTRLMDSINTKHRLLYVTPVLQKNIRISGVSKVTIKLASNKSAANLSVYLVSLPFNESKEAKIYENLITRGWADPQNHSSLTKGEPLVPGQFYELTFDLMPDDQVIPKGKQIGLLIFSSDNEFTLRPKPGTQLTIDLNSTSITIPIVGGVKEFEDAIKSR